MFVHGFVTRRALLVVALAGGLSACASSDQIDFGTHHDLSVGGGEDLAVPDGGADQGVLGACTQVATWQDAMSQAGYDPQANVTFLASARQSMEPLDVLNVEDWHQGTSYPKSVTFDSSANYSSCDVCVYLQEGCTQAGGCARQYFVQGGQLTVTRADTDPSVGRMTVSGSNLTLVEWQFPMQDADGGMTGDVPVPNGRCWQIADVSFDVPWDNGDGGVADDGGTPMGDGGSGGCHPVVNEVQTAGATASDEWVEVYNPCSTPIDVSNWTLGYRSANNNAGGSDIVLHKFAAATSLTPGQYFLAAGSGYTGSAAADATFASGLAASGAVGLRNGTVIIDSVSYGTLKVPNVFTETAPAKAPPASQSISRHPNGYDSNDNSTNFQITATPTPKAPNP